MSLHRTPMHCQMMLTSGGRWFRLRECTVRSALALLSSVDDMIYVANVRLVLIQSNSIINSQSRSRSEALVRARTCFQRKISSMHRLSLANGHWLI